MAKPKLSALWAAFPDHATYRTLGDLYRALGGAAALGAILAASGAEATPRQPVRRDVEGYAQAICLARQPSPELRAQGDGWASIIIQRGRGELDDWRPLRETVAAETARRPMYLIHGDAPARGPGSEGRPMAVAYCAELLDAPAVRRSVESTIRRMAPAYRRK